MVGSDTVAQATVAEGASEETPGSPVMSLGSSETALPAEPQRSSVEDLTSKEFALSEPEPKRARFQLPLDSFDCPVCSECMSQRIYQCRNGHHLCQSCLARLIALDQGCPSCQLTYPPVEEVVRCLALESLAQNCDFPCRYQCGFTGIPRILERHMESCENRPCACPIRYCNFSCPSHEMPNHLKSDLHKDDVVFEVSESFTLQDNAVMFWEQGSFPLHLLQQDNRFLCFHNLRIEGSTLRGKVLHFSEPLHFTFSLSGDAGRRLAIEGPTEALPRVSPGRVIHEEEQIVATREQCERYVKLEGELALLNVKVVSKALV